MSEVAKEWRLWSVTIHSLRNKLVLRHARYIERG